MDFFQTPEIQQLFMVLQESGIEARLVGGCVRDAILGLKTADIDVAVNVPPEKAQHILERAGIKVVPTGIDHGTITAVINKFPFQITSLRQDVQTFGRHAKVVFGSDWLEDAKRRDFTMNAMYLNEQGNLYDPFHGKEDLEKGIVRFIGDPTQRIQEDYLRILRYYRFLSYYGKETPTSIKELSELKEGLLSLSKERIQHEFLKLLQAKDPRTSLSLMKNDGVFKVLFGCRLNLKKLFALIELELALEIKPIALRRLYMIFENDNSIYKKYFRLASHQRLYLQNIYECLEQTDKNAVFYYFGRVLCSGWVLLKELEKQIPFAEKLKNCQQKMKWLSAQKESIFPLTGADLLQIGFTQGPEIGKLLKLCERWWIKNDFRPSKEECLEFCLNKR